MCNRTLYHSRWLCARVLCFTKSVCSVQLAHAYLLLGRCTTLRVHAGVAEAALALENALLRAIALFLEGKWSSRLPELLRLSFETPSSCLGSVLLFAQAIPPALPISIERLPHALVLLPPRAGPSRSSAAAAIVSCVDQAATPTPLPTVDGNHAPETGGKAPRSATLGDVESTTHALTDALLARRVRWRHLLTEASDGVREYILKLAGCSCQRASHVLAALLVRICDLLGGSSALQVVVQPLLRLQESLGRCASDESIDLPTYAPGNPAVALSRVTLLLATITAHPMGRSCVLAADGSLLLGGLLPTLLPGAVKGACHRTGCLWLKYLCDFRISQSTLQHGSASDGVEALHSTLPLSVLARAIGAVDALSTNVASGCADQVLCL